MSDFHLTIDERPVHAVEGDTVLMAAQRAGIEIPTLCAHPALEPYGACRLCIVQIEGMRGYPPSCTTPAAPGMVVRTYSPEITELRKNVLKLLLSGHTSPCLVCLHREPCEKYRPRPFKTGKATRCVFCSNRYVCELRKLADQFEISDLEVPILYRNLPLEQSDPFMDRDYNLCVLCGRCSRICEKIHEKGTIDFVNRGKEARISTAFGRLHKETNCRFCGACVDICPTGSLSDRFAKWHGAPDQVEETACTICPNGCSLRLQVKEGKVIAASMTGFSREARICAVGRFVLPQILSCPSRLVSHEVRVEDGLIKVPYEEAVAEAGKRLKAYSGERFAMIADASLGREAIHVLKKFTQEVMKSDLFAVAGGRADSVTVEPSSVLKAVEEGSVKALFTFGDYLSISALQGLELLLVCDLFPSEAGRKAHVVIAPAALGETDGTFLNAAGEIKTLSAAAIPPKGLRPEWKIICDIAGEMGSAGFGFESTAAISKELEKAGARETPPAAPQPSPLDDVAYLPKFYRGHRLSDIVCALKGLYPSEPVSHEVEAGKEERPFRIVEKLELVPNTHMVTVHAPVIAEKCMPGQFVIAMVEQTSERIPYTISDFDREKGTITMVTMEVGRSSRELAHTVAGEHLAHVAGPLGLPVEVKRHGTVVCAGGCFGVGAILPLARAMKEAGNRVICIEEASSHYLLHWQDRLSAACDELVIVTKDGSAGIKGGVQEAITMLAERGEKIDQAYIIGCTFMMMMVCEVTKGLGIPTQTAMNPLMLDGTGMCGACRVTVGGATRFACVDGPFLDGLQIDWLELISRQAAFKREEVDAMPQEPGPSQDGHSHLCIEL